MNINKCANELCDLIVENGGTVKLNTKEFNKFQHQLWDIWEDGYDTGQKHVLGQFSEFLEELK